MSAWKRTPYRGYGKEVFHFTGIVSYKKNINILKHFLPSVAVDFDKFQALLEPSSLLDLHPLLRHHLFLEVISRWIFVHCRKLDIWPLPELVVLLEHLEFSAHIQ
jgi:hypothetical protein